MDAQDHSAIDATTADANDNDNATGCAQEHPASAIDSSQIFSDHGYEYGSGDGDDYGYAEGFSCCGGEEMHSPSLRMVKHCSMRPMTPQATPGPFLTSFELFPNLPIEIKEVIWRRTLEPRVVEILYSSKRGFYSNATIPIALRACPDSRNAVTRMYPMCFGTVLHRSCVPRFTQFIASMSPMEAASIQSIAFDAAIEHYAEMDLDYVSEDSPRDTLQAASKGFKALKEVIVVEQLIDDIYEDGIVIPSGSGAPVLFEIFPNELQKFIWSETYPGDYPKVAYEDYEYLPGFEDLKVGFENVQRM